MISNFLVLNDQGPYYLYAFLVPIQRPCTTNQLKHCETGAFRAAAGNQASFHLQKCSQAAKNNLMYDKAKYRGLKFYKLTLNKSRNYLL